MHYIIDAFGALVGRQRKGYNKKIPAATLPKISVNIWDTGLKVSVVITQLNGKRNSIPYINLLRNVLACTKDVTLRIGQKRNRKLLQIREASRTYSTRRIWRFSRELRPWQQLQVYREVHPGRSSREPG